MKNLFEKGKVSRDWFGVESFLPGPRFTRESGRLYLLDEVGSTNAFLRGRGKAAEGRLCYWDGWGWKAQEQTLLQPVPDARPGTVVVARRQTAGLGRQGRTWFDCGGLHLSVVVPSHRASFDQGFSVWIGLLTVLVLREDFQVDARLKWPNDIVFGKRKLGGILLEKTGSGPGMTVVAGLGLNLSARRSEFPAALQGTATSIFQETERRLSPGEIAGRLLARVEAELDVFRAEGWSPYRPALSFLDCLLGQDVELVAGGIEHAGRAVGIDEAGRLQVSCADGITRGFHAGDVHLLPLPGEAGRGGREKE